LAQVIWTSGLSAFVALLVVWLTSRLASIRAHDDRVWDRKAGAYAGVFEALYAMEIFFDDHIEDHINDRDPSEAERLERQLAYKNARLRLGQVIAREVWLLSPQVKQLTDRLDIALQSRTNSWMEDMVSGSDAVFVARTGITQLAERDLSRPHLIPFMHSKGLLGGHDSLKLPKE